MVTGLRLRLLGFALATATAGAAAQAADAQVIVMTSGAFTSANQELSARFTSSSGRPVVTTITTMGVGNESLPNRLRRGEPADVVIVSDSALDEMIREGLVAADSKVMLARSKIGMAVRSGARKPDISTPAALRRALLEASSIAYSASVSGDYLSNVLFPRLGIAEQVRAKSKRIERERVGAVVARGEAEIGFQQISELLPVVGIDFVGALPPELQHVTIFSAGIVRSSKHADDARALLRFYSSPPSIEVIRRVGLEPANSNRSSTRPRGAA